MLFAIICTYKPDGDLLRFPFRPKHLQYMIDALPFTFFGGPLLLEDDRRSTGLVVIVDLPDRDAAVKFITEEPYAQAGLFETIAVRRWRHMTEDVLHGELRGTQIAKSL
ncbi:MAG: YciI family protein [Rhizomicrobium sp.]